MNNNTLRSNYNCVPTYCNLRPIDDGDNISQNQIITQCSIYGTINSTINNALCKSVIH